MTSSKPAAGAHYLLVTDFDGTMTRHDFYKLAAKSLLPPDIPDYWARYRAGQMTHFEALQAIFASIRADLATVRAVDSPMPTPPALSLPSCGSLGGTWRMS
jgi:2-hydroxy-3-keto-5-methylthiopentenyl-1-phosphate phosphatase